MRNATDQPIIIVKRRRGHDHAHHGGAWKVAYADFVTAMMAFFLLLWLMSTPDKNRLKGIAQYFQPTPPSAETGLGAGAPQAVERAGGSPQAVDAQVADAAPAASQAARLQALDLRVALLAMPEAQEMRSNLKVERSREGVRIQLMDTEERPMFRPGTAVLNGYAVALLRAIARQLGTRGARIAIEGHTDAVGGSSDRNWILSGERAQAARSTLMTSGLTPDRVAEVVALGATRPAFPDEPERAENRRVTIIVLPEGGVLPAGLAAPAPSLAVAAP